MTITYSWGTWEDRWPKGQFCCVFVEAQPGSDGMIHATGLYHAVDGEMLTDVATVQERISERTAVVGDGSGGLLVRKEFAELLAIMPAFLQEVSERYDDMSEAASDSNGSMGPQDTGQDTPLSGVAVSTLNGGR
jgi:hypothetical protein